MKKRLLIIIITILMVMFFFWCYFIPRIIFQKKFYFALPKSAEIIKMYYDPYWDVLDLKVRFYVKDYEVICKGIKKFDEIHGINELDKESIFFRTSVDYGVERFIVSYASAEQGLHGSKTRSIAILITQDKKNPEKYFLYAYY